MSAPVVEYPASAYVKALKALLPPGRLFFLEPDSEVSKTLAGMAEELARVDGRGADLIDEADPRTVTETIAEWEAMLSLPDEQIPAISGVLAERRVAITQKYTNRGGQNVAFFVALAAACGYTVEDRPLTVPEDLDVEEILTAEGSLAEAVYSYRVTAVSPYGESSTAGPFTVNTAGVPDARVVLRWTAVDGAVSYRVFRIEDGAGDEKCIGAAEDDGGNTIFFSDDGSATPGEVYPISIGDPPYAYLGIELFPVLRAGFRCAPVVGLYPEFQNARVYDATFAYAMRVNAQTPAGTALSEAEFEAVIRHATHSHVQVMFVYHP